ncbi:MAG: TonB-dependent receptor [Alistipes sp.]|nr:TonB-dependent receptor [Alistipes sp.]
MKQISLLSFIAVLLFAAPNLSAAEAAVQNSSSRSNQQQKMLRGNIVDEQGAYVSYVTIVAMQDGRQVSGVSSDNQGRFSFYLADGTYNIVIECVGYETFEREVTMPEGADMGTITLKESSTSIDEVVVKAEMIRREADRFVVDVANSASAIGKDGVELLRQSPGVWVKDDAISINGSSGTKVFINGREIKLSGKDLVNYVKALRAEDIAKIEVVPQTGADYDADSTGGVLLITLRRRLDNGVMGSVTMQTVHGAWTEDYNPSASINAHVGKFDISASGWYYNYDMDVKATEHTTYTGMDTEIDANSDIITKGANSGASLSAVAELSPRHSIGLSLDYSGNSTNNFTESVTNYRAGLDERLLGSTYTGYDRFYRYAATLNYIFRTDTLGSTLKIIADYNQSDPRSGNDNHTVITEASSQIDSLYRDRSNSTFRIATAQLARERYLSSRWKLSYGAKYTYNEINSAMQYRYLYDGAWVPSTVDDYDITYTENISAAYVTASMNYGRWSAVVGLRGEYTYAQGKGSDVEQNYFSLFPNANFSYALDKTGKHSLVAQYSRTITRPSFWNLTPRRLQVTDYTIQTGNPELDPQFVDQVTLTAVVGYKYSLTAGVQFMHDAIQQMVVNDAEDPRIMNLTMDNLPTMNQYFAMLNLPLTLTKWWDWNTSLTGLILAQRITAASPIEHNSMLQGQTTMTFKLPKKFFVDLYYSGMTGVKMANMDILANHSMTLTLKKQIKDSWILQCGLQNIIRQGQRLASDGDGFRREMETFGQNQDFNVSFAVTWNFKSGKQFRAKSVEKNDTSRM